MNYVMIALIMAGSQAFAYRELFNEDLSSSSCMLDGFSDSDANHNDEYNTDDNAPLTTSPLLPSKPLHTEIAPIVSLTQPAPEFTRHASGRDLRRRRSSRNKESELCVLCDRSMQKNHAPSAAEQAAIQSQENDSHDHTGKGTTLFGMEKR